MANNKYTRLVNARQWQALMDILPSTETILHFETPASLECFRVRVNQENAYGKKFNMSVCRAAKEIRISRIDED